MVTNQGATRVLIQKPARYPYERKDDAESVTKGPRQQPYWGNNNKWGWIGMESVTKVHWKIVLRNNNEWGRIGGWNQWRRDLNYSPIDATTTNGDESVIDRVAQHRWMGTNQEMESLMKGPQQHPYGRGDDKWGRATMINGDGSGWNQWQRDANRSCCVTTSTGDWSGLIQWQRDLGNSPMDATTMMGTDRDGISSNSLGDNSENLCRTESITHFA